MKKKQNKYKEPIKLDIDISFEEAMQKILNTPAKEVEEGVKKEETKKLLTGGKTQKLLPKPKK